MCKHARPEMTSRSLHDDDEVVVLLTGDVPRVADVAAGHSTSSFVMDDVDRGKVDDGCQC